MRNRSLFFAAVCLCADISVAVATDLPPEFTTESATEFATGAEAYDNGRYGDAFAAWHALATGGEVRAQVAIAGMYRSGEGRPVDFRKAAMWYRRAAEAGDPIAQLNFAELLETGRGVARDRSAALRWYSRAAAQGNAWAADQRDRLAARIR